MSRRLAFSITFCCAFLVSCAPAVVQQVPAGSRTNATPPQVHAESASQAATVRVMTWNIFAGKDLDRQSSLTRAAALIDSAGADVVLLQEVDRNTSRSGGVDQAAVLGELTGMHVVFGRAMDFDGGEYGIALLSRWPVHGTRVVPLHVRVPGDSAAPPAEPRVLLHVIADSPHGPLHILNTHVDHRAFSMARQQQIIQILAYVADNVPREGSVVFGGDLNAMPDAPEVRAVGVAFSDAWSTCGQGDGFTFRADQPSRRIDYILLSGAGCNTARVIDTVLSDHRPVLAEITLTGR